MADDTSSELLTKFLATFTTQFHYMIPSSCSQLWVFWNYDGSQISSSSSDHQLIHEKLKSIFSLVELSSFDGLIQFWAPVETGGRRLLITADQPFALKNLDKGLAKYRLCSLNYKYNVDMDILQNEEDPCIISGALATTFLSGLPEVVPDMSVHQTSPLVRVALELALMTSFFLPVFYGPQRCCVGVVECCTKRPADLVILKELNKQLKEVGLSTFEAQEHLPYINNIKHARDEMEEALKIVCESHNLVLAQVWVSYEDANNLPLSSTLECFQPKIRLALKLTGYDFDFSLKSYYDACDILPLKIGEGLAGMTLQSHEPYFCRYISRLIDNELVALLPTDAECSCFTICLRSTMTSNCVFVLEFFWIQSRNYIIMLESLLPALKRHLPSFKFASGAQLDDELSVVEVEDSTRSRVGVFKILENNRSSQVLTALGQKCVAISENKGKTTPIPLSRNDIEQHFGKTMQEAARNLRVSVSTLKRKCRIYGIFEWPGPNYVKRKEHDSYDTASCTDEENREIRTPSTISDKSYFNENTLTIKAEYEGDVMKFNLPISTATFKVVEKEISERFKLNIGTYKLEYQNEDKKWILMVVDQDMRDCIKSSSYLDGTPIRLRVLPYMHQISSSVGIQSTRKSESVISNGGPLIIANTLNRELETVETTKKSKIKRRKRIILSLEVVEQHFAKSISDAARDIGVTRSTLKRFCRENGVTWPTNQRGSRLSIHYDSPYGKNSLDTTNLTTCSIQAHTGSLYPHRSCHDKPIAKIPSLETTPLRIKIPSLETTPLRIGGESTIWSTTPSPVTDLPCPMNNQGLINQIYNSTEATLNSSNSSWPCQDNLFPQDESFLLGYSSHTSCSDYNSTEATPNSSNSSWPCQDNLFPQDGSFLPDYSSHTSFSDFNVGIMEELFTGMFEQTEPSTGSLKKVQDIDRVKPLTDVTQKETIRIKAKYKEQKFRLRVAENSGIDTLKKEIQKRLKLDVRTFGLKYLDDDSEWVVLLCDEDLVECVELMKSSVHNTLSLEVYDLSTVREPPPV